MARSKALFSTLISTLVLLSACAHNSTPPTTPGSTSEPGPLRSLSLASYELSPAFSPSVHDYTIRCEASSRITVRHTTDPSATVTLTPSAPVALSPGDLLTVDVSTAKRSESYRVRCLPEDFPKLEVRGTPGVWIQTVLPAHGARASYMVLLDEWGTPVFYKRYKSSPPFVSYIEHRDLPASLAAKLPEQEGALLEIPLTYSEFGPFSLHKGTLVSLYSLSGKLLSSWKAPSDVAIDHHDAVLLPSGNLLAVSYQETEPPTGMGAAPFAAAHPVFGEPGCKSGPFNPTSDAFLDSVILEITPDGSVLKSYPLKDILGVSAISFPLRFDTDQDPSSANCVFDAYHVNALDVTPDGGVLVSGLAMDGVVLIDRASSKPRFRVGGPTDASSFSIAGDPLGGLSRIHDGRLSATGVLSVFDNRIAQPTEPARGVLYRLDESTKKAVFVSSFATTCDRSPCASQWGGSFRLAANGSVVIAAGGRENGPSIEVLSPTGDRLASLFSPSVYRAVPVKPRLSNSELASRTSALNTEPVVLDGTCSTDYFGICN